MADWDVVSVSSVDADAVSKQSETSLTPDEEQDYSLTWKPQNAPRDSGFDYDLRGAYKSDRAGTPPARDSRGHGADTFKKPNHPAYSAGSKIKDPGGLEPGVWSQDAQGRSEFIPGPANLAYHSPDKLRDYFARVEPEAILNLSGEPSVDEWGVVDVTPLDPGDSVRLKMDNLDRSIGTISKDLAVKAAGGANAMVGSFAKGYGLLTGNMDNPVSEQLKSGQTYWEDQASPQLKAMEAERKTAIQKTDTGWARNAIDLAAAAWETMKNGVPGLGTNTELPDGADRHALADEVARGGVAVWETIKNPALIPTDVAGQVAQFMPILGAGKAAGAAAKAMGAGSKVAGTAAVGAGVATGAAMQGTDSGSEAYDRLMKLPDPIWAQNKEYQTLVEHDISPKTAKKRVALRLSRDAAAQAAIASGALNAFLPGGRTIERALSGVPVRGSARAGRAAAGIFGEAGTEFLEEGSGMVAQNRAVQGVNPNQPLMQGSGEAAGMGAIVGGGMGGAAGALSRGEEIETPPGTAPDAQTLDGELSVDDLIGEPVSRMDSASGTPTPDGGTTAPGAELPAFMPAPSQLSPADQRIRQIRDAINAGQPVPPSARNQAQEVPVEDVELAPAPTDPALIDAADELRTQMREPAPASNIDVDEQERTVTSVELAPPPVEQPSPVETPASNIDVSQPFDDIENIDAAPAPQSQRALPAPTLAVDSEGNAQPQAQADQERRAFTQKERVQYEHMQKRAAKLEAQGDVEGAIAIRRKMVGLEQQTVVQPIKALPAPVMAVDSAGNAALQSERDNADAKKQAELADIERRAAELERTDPEAALAMRRDAAGYQQTEGDNARAARSRAERLPPDWTDNRLARAAYRYGLRHMADNLEKGGGIAYKQDENGTITGRTPSLNPAWYQSIQQNPDYKMSVAQVKDAVKKALAGEKLGVREARMVGAMIDQMHGERSEQVDYAKQQLESARTFRKTAAEAIGITDDDVEQAGELLEEREYRASWDGPTRSLYELADDASAVDAKATQAILESSASDTDVARQLLGVIHGRTQRAPEANNRQAQAGREAEAPAQAQAAQSDTPRPEDETITPYTEADLAEREGQKASAKEARAKAETKAAADDARGDFTLTGSDRTADEAAAAGQQDLLAQKPAEKSKAAKPLYASRQVTNAADIISWAKEQGFPSTLSPDDLHVTVAYSREPVDGASVKPAAGKLREIAGKRSVEKLGDEGAVVLKFESVELNKRWQQYRDAGASWDYDGYMPHVTITYDGGGVDLSKVKPYTGPIELGAEKQEPLNLDKSDDYKETEKPTNAAEKPDPAAPKRENKGRPGIDRDGTLEDAMERGRKQRESVASQPKTEDPADIIKKIPPAVLRRIKVKVEQLHEGEGVKSVEVSATDALKDIRRETAAFKKLLDCVSR